MYFARHNPTNTELQQHLTIHWKGVGGPEWVQAVYSVVVVCVGLGIPIYLRESLKSPKWLIPEVAQPQVTPSKKIRNVLCAFLCVPSHKNQKRKKNKARVVMVIAEGV
jgi:hypothetical protein